MAAMPLADNGVANYATYTIKDAFTGSIGTYVLASSSDNKEEDKMNPDVFDDLKTVFGIGQEFKMAADFYKSLHYAAEGIRQQDALERVVSSFYGDREITLEWVEDSLADAKANHPAGKTTTIIGGNEEEQ